MSADETEQKTASCRSCKRLVTFREARPIRWVVSLSIVIAISPVALQPNRHRWTMLWGVLKDPKHAPHPG
jgi:hypothetical protein